MSDALTEGVVFLHNVFILCLIYVVGYYGYYLMSAFLWFFGVGNLNYFATIPFVSVKLAIICYVICRICVYILLILLVVLYWVFVFWMLIIIFVPFVVIFPIPIFPFIFILPLKPLMLALIPPFKTLTDLGTLPLTYRILSRLFNGEIFTNFINYFIYPTGSDVSKYLYFNANQIFQESSGYDLSEFFDKPEPEYNEDEYNDEYYDEFKNKNDDYSGKTKDMKDLETNDNPDDVNKYEEYIKNPSVSTGMKRIEEETDLCVNMRKKFKPYNASYTSELQTDADNSISPYNECYIKAIKSYLKTSIR
jgi:hypothetical protein